MASISKSSGICRCSQSALQRWGCDQSASAGGHIFFARRRWVVVSPARSPWRFPRGSATEQRQNESIASFSPYSQQLLVATPLSRTQQLARNRGAPVHRNTLHAL